MVLHQLGARQAGYTYDGQFAIPCPRGYFCPYSNGTVEVLACGPGTLCPEGSTEPLPCPATTEDGRAAYCKNGEALVSPAGYYAPGDGFIYPCEEGQVCGRGAASPSPCLPGFYCDGKTAYRCPGADLNIATESCDGECAIPSVSFFFLPIVSFSYVRVMLNTHYIIYSVADKQLSSLY
jgi:hypothetical protein